MPIHHFYSTDYEQKTGGWIYNRHLIAWLDRLLGGVREMTVPVCFPAPDAAVMAEIETLFDGIEPGAVLVMDHIYGCMLWPILQRRPFRLVLIYHHSMMEERGAGQLPLSPIGTGVLNVECEECAHPISPLEGEMSGRTEGGGSGANAAFETPAGPLLTPLCHLSVTSPPQGGRSEGVRGTEHSSIEHSALQLADAIIVTSDESRDYVTSHYGIAEQKIIIGKPGNDPAPQSRAHDGGPWHMLSVGAVIPRKRYEFLVEAFAKVERSDWSLTIAGNPDRYPDYVASLQNLIETHDLANRITLAGELPTEALETLWAKTHLYVASSLYEGYGMAISEAICRGVPVISTPSGAVASWAGEAATLVDADDVGEMARQITAVMADPATYETAREKVLRFAVALPSWEENMARVGEGLRQLV